MIYILVGTKHTWKKCNEELSEYVSLSLSKLSPFIILDGKGEEFKWDLIILTAPNKNELVLAGLSLHHHFHFELSVMLLLILVDL